MSFPLGLWCWIKLEVNGKQVRDRSTQARMYVGTDRQTDKMTYWIMSIQ